MLFNRSNFKDLTALHVCTPVIRKLINGINRKFDSRINCFLFHADNARQFLEAHPSKNALLLAQGWVFSSRKGRPRCVLNTAKTQGLSAKSVVPFPFIRSGV
jgi:hypothetical protein